MSPRKLASLAMAVLSAAFGACSDQSPVAPSASTDGAQAVTIRAQSVLGTYVLSVFSYTVEGLALKAEVKDASSQPASGIVIFQYCSLHGHPAPSSECETGSGHWVNWFVAYNFTGEISVLYGFAPSGTTVGFRFQYIGQGSGTTSHPSNTIDFTF
jgi:hypothetical protein